MEREPRFLIDGDLVGATDGATFSVTNPYTESQITEVPNGSAKDAELAVQAALRAAPDWASTPAPQRAQTILQLAEAIEQRAQELAVLDVVDSGAPISVMAADVRLAAESLRYFAGLALEMKGSTVPASSNLHFTERQPFGVVARIIPFNHPILFAASKIAAPLVAGNTVILKPAESTPLSALELGRIAQSILPAGTLGVVTSDGLAVPDAIVRHPDVRRIGFTGSEAAGRAIQRAAAEVAVKDVTLELGGKNALIAFPDADPAAVAAGAVRGMNFTWSGQSCGSTSRLLVHESIADEVLGLIVAEVENREYPSPLDPRAVQGTIVNRRQYQRILNYIDDAVDEGARILAGGGAPPNAERGLFIAPTILDEVQPTFRIASEEVFGPVLSVLRFRTEEEAVALANAVRYGLTGSVYTNDVRRAHRVARALETGYVWINGAGPHYTGMPYGGWKNSGLGREESIDELHSYTQLKSTNVILQA
ncbi:aldehyde dehydrogenase family protein [Mycolicibacterium smegmatis]|uniref:aldehyde dehydrogenase family protein n=1 Tax=Mycolicibacterium smegmatis TaxID=1772 RepID=UPI0020A3E9A4|nr:aldehyde dehydrogenase family protein [Mycolicibacterium smegmatis]MCP2626818.1 aldehyde dehydrogenase family protein [Mycolicibacterium smegmatis]